MNYDTSSILNLISHIHSQTQNFLLDKLKEKGLEELSSSHGNILFCLTKKNFMTLGELAEVINRDKSTTTVLVRKLESSGFVRIEKDSFDSRKKIITLTTEGKKYTELTNSISKELIDSAYKDFSDSEKNTLLNLLIKISKNFN